MESRSIVSSWQARRKTLILVGLSVLTCLYVLLFRLPAPDVRLQQGVAAIEAGELDVAYRIASSLEASDSGGNESRVLHGWLAMVEGNHRLALELLSPDLAIGKHRFRILMSIAECHYRLGQLSEAQTLLQDALLERPESAHAYRILAAIAYDQGDGNRAISMLSRLKQLAPDDYSAPHLTGVIYSEFSYYDEAVKELTNALQLNPPPGKAYEIGCAIAENQIELLRFEQALIRLDQIEDGPERDTLRAECLWTLGNKDAARVIIERLLDAGTTDSRLRWIAARALWLDQKDLRAAGLLRKLLAEDEWHVEGRYLLSQILASTGKREEAAAELDKYQKALSFKKSIVELGAEAGKHPDHAQVRFELAEIWQQMGNDRMASVWRLAAENCQRKSRTSSPNRNQTRGSRL